MLQISVAAGPRGPVMILSGAADATCVARLAGLIGALIPARPDGERRELTIDVSGLRYADSASIRTFVLAARTLKTRGGALVLLPPQQPVARILALLGADQMLTIRGLARGEREPGDRAARPAGRESDHRARRGLPNATPATPAE
jgi:anti-anti-sigma factor